MMKQSDPGSKILATAILAFLILSAFLISGFTIVTSSNKTITKELPAAQGNGCEAKPDNVIKNCSFETRDSNSNNGVALNWLPYSNGQAHTAWYDETWTEAVHAGKRAQLMEIFQVEANILDRVIAIHQSVDVTPNSTYSLTINALMRSQAPVADRNKNEFEMHWGVDFSGRGDYDNVETWNLMPLTEQFRPGSTGEYPEDKPLFYQTITGTVQTGGSNRITLFIRGLKKFPTGTEVNFDVDNVSLIGVAATAQPIVATAEQPTPAVPNSNNLPATGTIRPRNVSGGALAVGGLVLIALGLSAVIGVFNRKE